MSDTPMAFHLRCYQCVLILFPECPGFTCVYRKTLITHVLMMLSMVWILMCLLFQIILNSAKTPDTLAILLLISLLQLSSVVSKLPKYTHTHCDILQFAASTIRWCPTSSLPLTIVCALLMLIVAALMLHLFSNCLIYSNLCIPPVDQYHARILGYLTRLLAPKLLCYCPLRPNSTLLASSRTSRPTRAEHAIFSISAAASSIARKCFSIH